MDYKHYPPTTRESDWPEATYVAWLLGVPPSAIFPLWTDCREEDNDHLLMAVMFIVDDLLRVCEAGRSDATGWAADMRTLKHCYEVLNGVPTLVEGKLITLYPDLRDNGWYGQGIFYNFHEYHRGAWDRWSYLLKGGRYG